MCYREYAAIAGRMFAKAVGNSGNTSRFVCPYHLWSYELDGRLRAAPEMRGAPGFDKSSIRLPEVRHEVWEGFVFVNLSGTADPLGERLAPLQPYIREYDLPSWKVVATRDWESYPGTGRSFKTMAIVTIIWVCIRSRWSLHGRRRPRGT